MYITEEENKREKPKEKKVYLSSNINDDIQKKSVVLYEKSDSQK